MEPYHLPHNELLTVRSQHVYAHLKGTGLQLVNFRLSPQDHLLFGDVRTSRLITDDDSCTRAQTTPVSLIDVIRKPILVDKQTTQRPLSFSTLFKSEFIENKLSMTLFKLKVSLAHSHCSQHI